MRLGIMQPYFFPYPGHFALIAHCDEWIVFDTSQYTPKSWMSRNRVLHPSAGANWISVPLANGSISIRTHEAQVLDMIGTRDSVLGKLSHCRRQAPFHAAVENLIRQTFALPAGDGSLVHLNVRGLDLVCAYLGLPFRRRVASELRLDLPVDLGPGEWALEICDRLGASEYLNPLGGRVLFDPAQYQRRGIGLNFLDWTGLDYPQGRYAPVRGLSILDALLWNPPEQVRAALSTRGRVVPAELSCERTASSES